MKHYRNDTWTLDDGLGLGRAGDQPDAGQASPAHAAERDLLAVLDELFPEGPDHPDTEGG